MLNLVVRKEVARLYKVNAKMGLGTVLPEKYLIIYDKVTSF